MTSRPFRPVKIGSSYYICIPKKVVEAIGVKEKSFIITVKGSQIIYDQVKGV